MWSAGKPRRLDEQAASPFCLCTGLPTTLHSSPPLINSTLSSAPVKPVDRIFAMSATPSASAIEMCAKYCTTRPFIYQLLASRFKWSTRHSCATPFAASDLDPGRLDIRTINQFWAVTGSVPPLHWYTVSFTPPPASPHSPHTGLPMIDSNHADRVRKRAEIILHS